MDRCDAFGVFFGMQFATQPLPQRAFERGNKVCAFERFSGLMVKDSAMLSKHVVYIPSFSAWSTGN